jgi:hypothetical membrane protein
LNHKACVAYQISAGVFLGGVIAQFFFAGIGVFAWDYRPHMIMGGVLHGLSLILWALAAYARLPRPTARRAAFMFALLFLQGALPHLRGIVPAVAALHPVTALIVFWLAVALAREARAFGESIRFPTGVNPRPAHAVRR